MAVMSLMNYYKRSGMVTWSLNNIFTLKASHEFVSSINEFRSYLTYQLYCYCDIIILTAMQPTIAPGVKVCVMASNVALKFVLCIMFVSLCVSPVCVNWGWGSCNINRYLV